MKKLLELLKRLLHEGLSPEKASLAAALGISFGLCPLIGPVTLMLLGLAFILRLNKPLVIAAGYSMSFVKPVLIIPFLKLGEWIFRADPLTISVEELAKQFSEAPMATLREFAWSFAHATVGWLAVTPLLMGGIYLASMSLIRKWHERRARHAQKQG